MEANIGQYEVQSGVKFAHRTEPIVSFARREFWINMGCLKRMPDIRYVHFMLLRQTRKLYIKAGIEETMDVVRWCTPSGKPRRVIIDADLWHDITSLMGWNDTSRYRLLGRFVSDRNGGGFVFDLARAEVFPLDGRSRSGETMSKKVPAANFTWDEHCKSPLITRFAEDTLITVGEGDDYATENNRTQAVLV